MLQAIQNFLRLHRRIHVKVPISMVLAREHVATALSRKIMLSGKFQVTRHYWGRLGESQLKLYGPKTLYNRQFCFRVVGELSSDGAEAQFNGDMNLLDRDVDQLLLTMVVLFLILVVVVRWGVILVLPVFLGFLYGMVQWHFQFYAKEITQLIVTLMTGEEPRSQLFSQSEPEGRN